MTRTNHSTAQATPYRDKKKAGWLISTLIPLLPLAGILPAQATQNEMWLWLPIAVVYLLIPALDLLLGEDSSNPPESAVKTLEADNYYRYITMLSIPVVFIGFFSVIAYFVSTDHSWAAYIALVMNCGFVGSLGINAAHEMGHKKNALEKTVARLALVPSGYGHFCIDHNRGHHRDVSTPDDPASAKLGENIYQFALREVPGVFKRAWQLEKTRLHKAGKALYSFDNEILVNWSLTLVLYAALILAFGITLLPFLILQAMFAYFQLTSANYIEHYGLLRGKRDDGRYEACQPHHSWNSNHVMSNLILFHLERHSDHHANPARRYQALRHFDNAPQLPNGYFGMFVVAYIPPLWRYVMDKRVLKQNGANLEKSNYLERKKSQYAAFFQAGLHS
jgi:alkane 1-monooxygenase